MMSAMNSLHIPTWHFLSPSSGGADPSPSHSCGEQLYTLCGAPVQDGTFHGVAFSFGTINLEDSGLLIVKRRACAP
jgi:hypothetical protein